MKKLPTNVIKFTVIITHFTQVIKCIGIASKVLQLDIIRNLSFLPTLTFEIGTFKFLSLEAMNNNAMSRKQNLRIKISKFSCEIYFSKFL